MSQTKSQRPINSVQIGEVLDFLQNDAQDRLTRYQMERTGLFGAIEAPKGLLQGPPATIGSAAPQVG